jgi:hypothetical protein
MRSQSVHRLDVEVLRPPGKPGQDHVLDHPRTLWRHSSRLSLMADGLFHARRLERIDPTVRCPRHARPRREPFRPTTHCGPSRLRARRRGQVAGRCGVGLHALTRVIAPRWGKHQGFQCCRCRVAWLAAKWRPPPPPAGREGCPLQRSRNRATGTDFLPLSRTFCRHPGYFADNQDTTRVSNPLIVACRVQETRHRHPTDAPEDQRQGHGER